MGVTSSAGAVIHVTVLSYLEGGLLGHSGWLQQVLRAPPIGASGRTVVCFRRIGIPYKYSVFAGRDSLDNTSVTGSLLLAACGCRLADFIAEGLVLGAFRSSADSLQFAVCRALRIILRHWSDIVMATGGDGPVDSQSGMNFGVELDIPWNAPEVYVDVDADGVYDLATVPNVIGLHARWPGAPVVKVLLCWDTRSVRALIPTVGHLSSLSVFG